MTSAITPFHVSIPAEQLADLRARLANTRWPDQPEDVGWRLGIPVDHLRDLAEYWRTGFDWRAQERRLNTYPQFTTEIDGTGVHFVHVRSAKPDARPLLLSHGWPSQFTEYLDLVEPLAEDFHVVLVSLPGFGFPGPPREADWGPTRIADAFAELMTRLGYERFAAHAPDWGGIALRELAVRHPDRLLGVHLLNMVSASAKSPADLDGLTGDDLAAAERSLARFAAFSMDIGHVIVQGTRPQTFSYGLTDSPVGQLAWIAEKFRAFSGADTDVVDRDHVLTTASIYWFTATANSAARIYTSALTMATATENSVVPTGMAIFANDATHAVRALAERFNNIVRWTEFDGGGHFPALEAPDLLLAEIRAFVSSLDTSGLRS
jgi:pimeloyl-ACP methyl ester carboxylesterase